MLSSSKVTSIVLVALLCVASPALARTSTAPPGLQPHVAETAWLVPGSKRRGLQSAALPTFQMNTKGLIDFTAPPRFPLEIQSAAVLIADAEPVETVPLPASMLLLGALVLVLIGKRRPPQDAPVNIPLRRL